MVADRKRDSSTRASKLVSDLCPRSRSTHDQDATGVKLIWVAVVNRRELSHVSRYESRDLRDARCTAGTRGNDHCLAHPLTVVGHGPEPVVGWTHGLDHGVPDHRRLDLGSVRFEELRDLGRRHVPVRIVARILAIGQPGHPIGSEKTERVPPFGFP